MVKVTEIELNCLHNKIEDYLNYVDGFEDEAHDLSVFIQECVNQRTESDEADEAQIKQLEHK